MSEETPDRKFDLFELCTAILLGLTAIGAAICGQQAGQWGGKQLDAFGEANTLATKAAAQYNEDMVLLNADYAAIANAKVHILEARDAAGAERERHLEIANYFYTTQLTEQAYQAMGLPQGFFVDDEADSAAPAAVPAAAAAAPAAAEAAAPAATEATASTATEPADAAAEAGVDRDIPDAALFTSLAVELDESYTDSMVATGQAMFNEADARFAEGRQANNNGDEFDLAGLFFTIALFFAGLGLVFKSSVRWKFFMIGSLVFVASLIYMLTLNWTA
ncbi:MAG TPA: hypothetical protein PKM88_01010 [bacterium]|nr:hypothetical protein [bacterium]